MKQNSASASQKSRSDRRVQFAPSLPPLHPDAAGIDLGAREHWVAVPADRSASPVRKFGCYTPDLHAMAAWLRDCGITTVAMESTGVYWKAVYYVLEDAFTPEFDGVLPVVGTYSTYGSSSYGEIH